MTLRALAALLLAGMLGACAATPASQLGTQPARFELSGPAQEVDFPLRVYDPWEGTNRAIYKFNAQFDRYVFLPAVNAYEFVTPDFIEDRVTDFFSNLTEFRNATNGLMQARPDVAGRAVIRFALNSTVGLLGLFDVATPLGVMQQPQDFGLTLGHWGGATAPTWWCRCSGRPIFATLVASSPTRSSPRRCRPNPSSRIGSTSTR